MSRAIGVVMAAGRGNRMKSDLPKVLFPVRGRPMIEYVLDALAEGGVERTIVVVGYKAADVQAALASRPQVEFAVQQEQLGTGHAVMACRHLLDGNDGPTLVVAGDAPMMQSRSVAALVREYQSRQPACILGTAFRDNPKGLGRIIRDGEGRFQGIAEEKDATEDQKRINEVNMSYYVFRTADLLKALNSIRPENAQREYYLTDCPGVLHQQGKEVLALPVLQPIEALGVNTLEELAAVEAAMARMSA